MPMREHRSVIVRVKPGFVDTPMTAGIDKGGPLWATPDRVARGYPAGGRPRAGGRLYALVLVADHDDHPPSSALYLPPLEDLKARGCRPALPLPGRPDLSART